MVMMWIKAPLYSVREGSALRCESLGGEHCVLINPGIDNLGGQGDREAAGLQR